MTKQKKITKTVEYSITKFAVLKINVAGHESMTVVEVALDDNADIDEQVIELLQLHACDYVAIETRYSLVDDDDEEDEFEYEDATRGYAE